MSSDSTTLAAQQAQAILSCTQVSPQCPVEFTTYGYVPNLGANLFFCIIFGICGVIQIILSTRYRTWTWMIGLAIGCLMELTGFVGRVVMHYNAWNLPAFKEQAITLVLAPSFIAAGICLTLKHMALTFGERWSRIPPRWYTWGFICFDASCIIIQAIGAIIASGGDATKPKVLKTGADTILAGIALQVAQLATFGLVAAELALRLYRHRAELPASKLEYARSRKFKIFAAAIVLSYTTILIRCIYRLPEFAEGWGQGLQREEPKFLVLDSTMVSIAAIALTAAHPGIFFPQLAKGKSTRESQAASTIESGGESEEKVTKA